MSIPVPPGENSPLSPSQEDAASVSETASVPVTSADDDILMSDDNAASTRSFFDGTRSAVDNNAQSHSVELNGVHTSSQHSNSADIVDEGVGGNPGPTQTMDATDGVGSMNVDPMSDASTQVDVLGPNETRDTIDTSTRTTDIVDINVAGNVDVDMSDSQSVLPLPPVPHTPRDLASAIKGMYRILDLVSEPGSGGLDAVDKIIIAQDSFGRFANDVCPGSYQSMTHVKFTSLDAFDVKPLGLYGSKSELVRFIQDLGVVEENIALLLTKRNEDPTDVAQPMLRSGLYFLRDPSNGSVIYVVYWPEDTTWDDNATSAVHRNRVTFMRYLTKITDQVVALISDEHANTIVWTEDADCPEMDEDENDRLFTFEVAKTKEQEESVSVKPGFQACDKSFRLASNLSEDALDILLEHGLGDRAPDQVKAMKSERVSVEQKHRAEVHEQMDKANADLKTKSLQLLSALSTEMARIVAKRFRYIFRNIEPDELLSNLAAIYPAVTTIRKRISNNAKLKSVSTKPFNELKTQLLALQSKFEKNHAVTEAEQRTMVEADQNGSSTGEGPSEKKPMWNAVWTWRPGAIFSQSKKGSAVDDKDFLNSLTALSVKYPTLADLVQQAFTIATSYFLSCVETEASRVAKEIEEVQREECTKQLNMALKHQLAALRDRSRSEFLQAVEDAFVKDVHE
ncbi:hypothetical protein EIP86_011392 [Pleurotus ostreatoroseus]|nr:hypothetical protein EIP86_011392 [Pleurotus ostreatoroseus]